MAHAIIFTDRPPVTWNFDQVEWNKKFYSYPAGAYKIASQLREQGLTALVVPNCSSFSLAGIKQIIEQNSKDLVWVGLSTTLFYTKSTKLKAYRQQWRESTDAILTNNLLYDTVNSYFGPTEMIWATEEVNTIAQWTKQEYNAPFLIGGSWVTVLNKGNLGKLDSNCYIVPGRAETYIEKFTFDRMNDTEHEPPVINNNNIYDDTVFKKSIIRWEPEDLVQPNDWLPLEISRGCAFNCAYCDYERKATTDSYKDPEILYQELLRNYEHYGVTRYMLLDDLYNDNKEKIRILYDRVWSRLPFKPEWTSYMRLDMFWADPESASIIQASGARMGSFGIETLHDRAGKKVGKGLGKTRILETLQFLNETWKKDVLISGLFIAGLPFEPRESIEQSMQWTHETDLLYSWHWTPMWITPPSHKLIVNRVTAISNDNDRYGITWLDDQNWINSEGVTFKEVDQMVSDFTKNQPQGLKVSFGVYTDLRTAGITHDEIVDIRSVPLQRIAQANNNIINKVNARIGSILQLHDR
jgi:hypothetical protein